MQAVIVQNVDATIPELRIGMSRSRQPHPRSEVIAVEIGVRILHLDLLESPPRRGRVGDVGAPAAHQARVQYAGHPALAIKDERARVALGGERASRTVTVAVESELDGLDTRLVAGVGLEPGGASDREVGAVPVFHRGDAGHSVAIPSVGIGQLLAREAAVDPELTTDGKWPCYKGRA